MKKIFFGSKAPVGGNEPFWKPWGAKGWLLRLLGFLVLLFALLFLLSLFKGNKNPDPIIDDDDEEEARTEIPDPIINPSTPDPVRVPIDTTANFPHDIQAPGPNLPDPGENILPPHTDDDIVGDDGQRIVGDRLNVILDSSADDATFNRWADEFKALYPGDEYKVVYYDRLTKLLQIQVPRAELRQIMEALPQQITDISFKVFHEALMDFNAGYKPNDPAFEYEELSWYFGPIQAYEAWEITKGSPDVTVAIVDSYFDLNHDELNSRRIVKPFCIPRRTGNVAPPLACHPIPFMHGSMVASMALGNMDNRRGTSGIAPLCRFMPVSVGHEPTTITVIQGLLYAIYQGANVVNLSMGFIPDGVFSDMSVADQVAVSQKVGQVDEDVWNFIVKLAIERNVTIVWAAGNENSYLGIDPSKRSNQVINVSAVDADLRMASFTNYGNFPQYDIHQSTISAPGVDIVGAKPWNTYEVGPGTSFAAPIVTGAVALMKSLDPTLSTPEIIRILQETGKPVRGEAETVGPLLQIKDALLKVKDNFANFDDIMSDHRRFIGLWETTSLLYRVDSEGNTTSDRVRILFDVKSETGGDIIYYEPAIRTDFTAPITIAFERDAINITQTRKATSRNNSRDYSAVPYTCRPDSGGLLSCSHTNSRGELNRYKLKKVRQRNYNAE